MDEITVTVGMYQTSNGIVLDERRKVKFRGEKLAEKEYPERSLDGRLSNNRGVTRTLYRTDGGAYIVHVHAWSKWAGEPDTWRLYRITEEKLLPGGEYDDLGLAAGLWEFMPLDKALS